MNELQPADFAEFFGALYQHKTTGEPMTPMSWQAELAAAACAGQWPDYICVPTGAGKTSTIDIALFALAYQADLPADKRTAPMRTFLVVDRRTVVSEAFYRAEQLQQKLTDAKDGILRRVADRLLSYSSGTGMPVKAVELRGGIYRDPSWCNSLIQPMIVTSTVDQVGSRLLFRGYGVSESSRPIQAAVIAHDSLIILDEAHISRAFSETLGYVRGYQSKSWSDEIIPLHLRIVEMTATPQPDTAATKLEIDAAELADPSTHIGNIVNTPKPTTLEIAEKVKGAKAPAQLAAVLVAKAVEWVSVNAKRDPDQPESDVAITDSPPKVIAILCNMVATAKEVRSLLLKNRKIEADQVHLVIGAMRPIDRDEQTKTLRELISTGANRDSMDKPLFVVATQCIEVGADYDFDALITEAAPLDSLVQRFGRLNRSGRKIPAVGHIVIRGDRVKDDNQLEADDKAFKSADPIYGNAMSFTWNWLNRIAENGLVDFGIANFKQAIASADEQLRQQMSTEYAHAPVLLPAHLDLLCQTTIAPWPDPDVSLWLHGPRRNDPEVQVCWRADLVTVRKDSEKPDTLLVDLYGRWSDETDRDSKFIHAVSLCPPSSTECLSIPLRRVVAWLTAISKQKSTEADLSSDLPSIVEESDTESYTIPLPFRPVAWRGLEKSVVVQNVQEIRPGDTLVFPVTAGGWSELGYIPNYDEWNPKTDEGRILAYAIHDAYRERQRFVSCICEDFEKLTKLDRADQAFAATRNRSIIRLHRSILDLNIDELQTLYRELPNADKFKLTRRECLELLQKLPDDLVGGFTDVSASRLQIEYYADRSGIVVKGPMRCSQQEIVLPDDDGSDLYSRVIAGKPIELTDHLSGVRDQAIKLLDKLPLDRFKVTILRAAETHDWGKADARFQAMLLGGDLYAALWEDKLYAKSAKMPGNLQDREYARSLSELPKLFRHELLSLSLIEASGFDDLDAEQYDLLLHLVATHHGFARPWAPVCNDPDPPQITLAGIERPDIEISKSVRQFNCWHRVDSPIISRFWRVTRRFGWWGTVFLESVLRLADRRTSQIESQLQASTTTSSKPSSVGVNV